MDGAWKTLRHFGKPGERLPMTVVFEFEKLTIDRPVTALIVDEPLESAVTTILDRLPWDHFIFQSLRGGKLLVSGHKMAQERNRRALPDSLRIAVVRTVGRLQRMEGRQRSGLHQGATFVCAAGPAVQIPPGNR